MAATLTGSALWYLTRATGVVSLVLLTLVLALGAANVKRLRTARLPRFVLDAVHRHAALLAVVFLFVHVISTVIDGYVPIRLADALIPFGSAYKPFWLGLGALSLDLALAVVLTSLLRRRLGHRLWRATHWLAYMSWPLALAHSLGTGSDAGRGWMQATALGCAGVVAAALGLRLGLPAAYDLSRSARRGSVRPAPAAVVRPRPPRAVGR